jgi:hypothetical protein
MDAVDSAVSRDNVPVPLTKYPTAHGHWRPTDPTLASTMAHGVFVIQTNVGNPTPDLQTLSSLAEKTFDAEIALLDHFQPTPVDKIGKLSKDPDGLLGRLVDLTPGTQPMLSKTVATYGPNGALTNQTTKQHEEKVYQKAGVDRLALWLDTQFGASEILRARDVGAASALLPDLTNNDDDLARSVDGVQNLPDAKCFEMSKNVYRKRPVLRFTCFVGYDRFVARVYGATETDARQRTAAQYALLVNPL